MTTRAIDTNETAILDLLRWCDGGGAPEMGARLVAAAYELTPDRLTHLTRVWCAIAGVPSPV